MLKYGLEYDHSFSHHDCQCYWLRTGDKWIPIDYDKHPDHWMKPLEAGITTGLCEIPASWYADDLPPMMFIVRIAGLPRWVTNIADHPSQKKAPNSHGWVNPRDVEEMWMDRFKFFYREYDEGFV